MWSFDEIRIDFDSEEIDAPLAQLVEQRILNPWVVGSSPTWRTIY